MGSSSRKLAIQKARQYLASRSIFLDTETTGLNPWDEIIELSLIDDLGAVLFDSLVKPRQTIPAEAIRIHGITDEMVINAPYWSEVWPDIERKIKDKYIGIYNADFDLRMIQQTHRSYGLSWQPAPGRVFDIMKIFSEYIGSTRWSTLESAGRQCGIPLPNSHRALADSLLARAILEYIATRTV